MFGKTLTGGMIPHVRGLAWLSVLAMTSLGCSVPTENGVSGPLPMQRQTMALAGGHSCLLDSDGIPVCWGVPPSVPAPVGDVRFVTITGEWNHFCGLTADSTAFCWGQNHYGQLGDGTRQPATQPVQVATDLRFIAIAATAQATCALDGSGRAYCWGRNTYGVLGNGRKEEDGIGAVPAPVATKVRFRVLSGSNTFCGIALNDRVYCWGMISGTFYPDKFYLAPGDCAEVYYIWYTGKPCLVPTPLAGGVRFQSVTGARCGVSLDDRAYCWGDGLFGQLGINSAATHSVPAAPVATEARFATLAASPVHTCGLTLDGQAFCWGFNTGGQLGIGEDGGPDLVPTGRLKPTPVLTSERYAVIGAANHTCAVTVQGEVQCWGPGFGNVPQTVPMPE